MNALLTSIIRLNYTKVSTWGFGLFSVSLSLCLSLVQVHGDNGHFRTQFTVTILKVAFPTGAVITTTTETVGNRENIALNVGGTHASVYSKMY